MWLPFEIDQLKAALNLAASAMAAWICSGVRISPSIHSIQHSSIVVPRYNNYLRKIVALFGNFIAQIGSTTQYNYLI
jgi:hypothetical protein